MKGRLFMNNIRGSTTSETNMIKAIQKAVGAAQDGIIGTGTMTDLAAKIGAQCWPLTIKLYDMPVIICNDITAFNPGKSCGSFANSLSGSFSYQKKPCSILISGEKTLWSAACHAHINKPESVLYRLDNGRFGVKRCLSASALPSDVRWAIGGMGLLDFYDTAAEGFTGAYSDVLRKTNHTMIGVKNDLVYLCYCKNMTGTQVNDYAKKLGLTYAIMLDGGHVAAINGGESFARINTGQAQYYLIQGV
jgi:hypothetical protein